MNPTSTPTTARLLPDHRGAAFARYLICLNRPATAPAKPPRLPSSDAKQLRRFKKRFACGTRPPWPRDDDREATTSTTSPRTASAVKPSGFCSAAFDLRPAVAVDAARRVPREISDGSGRRGRRRMARRRTAASADAQPDRHDDDRPLQGDTDIVVTKEAVRFGAIAEQALRDIVMAAVAKYVDAQTARPPSPGAPRGRPR